MHHPDDFKVGHRTGCLLAGGEQGRRAKSDGELQVVYLWDLVIRGHGSAGT